MTKPDFGKYIEQVVSNEWEGENMNKHHHVADHDDDGNLLDRCAKCGEDIRNEIHIRSNEDFKRAQAEERARHPEDRQ